MRTTPVFALILVGTMGAVDAQPRQEETSGRVSLNEDDAAAQRNQPRAPGDWVELASPTPAKHGTEYISVGKEAGGFGTLRLDAVKGNVAVKRVQVTFTDGTAKIYRLDKKIRAKGPTRSRSVLVELPTTREIDRVIVVTDRRGSGEYTLHGSGTGGVVANR